MQQIHLAGNLKRSMANEPTERKTRKRVTIRDVAQAAGVSVGAASTALRNTKSNVVLSESTRQRILQAARDLRYRPNAAARAMAGRRLQTLGVLASEYCMTGSYYGVVWRGIVTAAEAAGYHLMMKMLPTGFDPDRVSFFAEQLTDGVIIPIEAEERTRDALQRFNIPHIWLNAAEYEPFNCVHSDEQQGLQLAVDHLIELGHRHIAYLPHGSGDRHSTTIARETAYLAALRARDLLPVPTFDKYTPIGEHLGAYLDMDPRPTAIIAYSDAVGIWALNHLLERGVRVPQDLSVVGNEGAILNWLAYRKLTTVKAPTLALGRKAVELLLEQLRTGKPTPSVRLPQRLEILESTAPPAV